MPSTRAGCLHISITFLKATKARLLLVVLCIGWGTAWVTMRMALDEIPPFSMRVGDALARRRRADELRAACRAARSPIAHRRTWLHICVASLFNIVAFSVFTPFAQLAAETSRVAIMVYTMPIWAAMLALPILGERLTPTRIAALALCVAGMAILICAARGLGNSGRHHARARRRHELGRRHRLSEMGEARRRSDGDHDLAARVRRWS